MHYISVFDSYFNKFDSYFNKFDIYLKYFIDSYLDDDHMILVDLIDYMIVIF
jgi:hypothetical protein